MGTAIVIASGKGGTGKTSLTGGLGSCLAAMGHRVLCIDMDMGLRNLDLTLGMSDRILMDFTDVLSGYCTLEEAAVAHSTITGLHLLTAPVTTAPEELDSEALLPLLEEAKAAYDFVLLDAPAGMGKGFELAARGADRAIIVVTADPASLRDGQRISLLLDGMVPVQQLVVNRVQPRLLQKTAQTIDDAMDAVGLGLLGLVPEDIKVPLAGSRGLPVIMTGKRGAPLAYYRISKRLLGQHIPLNLKKL